MIAGVRVLLFFFFALLHVFCGCSKPQGAENERSELSDLGHHLFFDTRISFNNTKSCASCHDPAFAFSDGYRRSITATGDMTLRNSPSLINVSDYVYFDWANPDVTTLEQQHQRPFFGESPVELGAKGHEEIITRRLLDDEYYKAQFKRAFPGDSSPVTLPNSISAIAAYVKSIRSLSAPYDGYAAGDSNALTSSEKLGRELFFSNRTQCASCHPPPFFTLASGAGKPDSLYINIGLYHEAGTAGYPERDPGLRAATKRPTDDGKFRIPSLRNVAFTAPYMHDGSVASLEEVVAIYQRGGRLLTNGRHAGDGRLHPYKDTRVSGFSLSSDETRALVDFLYALSDSTIFLNPQFLNPFRALPE